MALFSQHINLFYLVMIFNNIIIWVVEIKPVYTTTVWFSVWQ